MDTPFLGGIYPLAFNFAPKGFATCDGQILSISTNTALFALVGTYYGGNGTSNFALPDLRGRTIIHQGQGAGLGVYTIGQVIGTETHTLTQAQMPVHNHLLSVYNGVPDSASPSGALLAAGPQTGSGPNASQLKTYDLNNAANATLANSAINNSGGGQSFSVLQPSLVMTYVIALQGIFPSRN